MSRMVGFDYSCLSPELRGVVFEHANAINAQLRQSTAAMIDIGRRLIEVRELLGLAFLPWIRAEFEWSLSAARDYIKIAERFGELDCVDAFQLHALIVLSRKHTPETAVSEAIALARSGVRVSRDVARAIVDRHLLNEFPRGNSGDASAILPAVQNRPPSGQCQPARYVRQVLCSLRSFRNNWDEISRRITPEDRRILADQLIAFATELVAAQTDAREAVIEVSEEPDDTTVSRSGSKRISQRRELADV